MNTSLCETMMCLRHCTIAEPHLTLNDITSFEKAFKIHKVSNICSTLLCYPYLLFLQVTVKSVTLHDTNNPSFKHLFENCALPPCSLRAVFACLREHYDVMSFSFFSHRRSNTNGLPVLSERHARKDERGALCVA